MSPRAPDVPEQVRQFAPKEKPPPAPKEGPPRSDGDVLDEVGQAILGLLQHAAKVSNEACDRAMGAADKLSIRLRDAEDRVNQLQSELEQCRDRAKRAEDWLQRIYQEIEEKLTRSRQ